MTDEASPPSVDVAAVTGGPLHPVMVLTAPLNQPVSSDQLVQGSAAVADLQSQLTALAARVTALESAAGEASTASEGGSHEHHRNTTRSGPGHRHP